MTITTQLPQQQPSEQKQRIRLPQGQNISQEEGEEDVVIKTEPSIISTSAGSSTLNYTNNSNKIKHCSFALKVVGLLIIVGIVLLFALLPNYLRNKNAQDTYSIEHNTDPNNAKLPAV